MVSLMPSSKLLPIVFAVFSLQFSGGQGRVSRTDVLGLTGEGVTLGCAVNKKQCGNIHNIKWYKNNQRVFVFSELAKIQRPEGDLAGRSQLFDSPDSSMFELVINPLKASDEGVYKCDITYLEVKDECAVVQFVNLTTLAKPQYLSVALDGVGPVKNGSRVGPYKEGTEITLICEAGGGKPTPKVSWMNGTTKMPADYQGIPRDDGTGTGVSEVHLFLTRGDLGTKLECQAENDAIDHPLASWVELDVLVRPSLVELSGINGPLREGAVVSLTCHVEGARPAPNITWYKNSTPLDSQPDTTIVLTGEGTYNAESRLTLTATRSSHGTVYTCAATNQVLVEWGEGPMESSVRLDVRYAPTVVVSPANVRVNETTDVFLECQYDANPSNLTAVIWYKDGRELRYVQGKDKTPQTRYNGATKFSGGTLDDPSLVIHNISRHDGGDYACFVENEVGISEAKNSAEIDVLHPPEVKLVMEPGSVANELDRQNITLACIVISANPETLLSVRWNVNGSLLKELPDCAPAVANFTSNETADFDYDLCEIDPTRMMLEYVGRRFVGDYSCEGRNEAGWGKESPEVELVVHYPPGEAVLIHNPPVVIKGMALTLTCEVENRGYPPAETYRWTMDDRVVPDVTTADWVIDPVTLKTQANFSCVAVNPIGEGVPGTLELDVGAPPAFIESLPPYYGTLYSSKRVSISCRVECSPLCRIIWQKNGVTLDDSELYSIHSHVLPEDPMTNDFQSIVSSLTWNMTNWPGGQLDRLHDNANYSCHSTGNNIGDGVSSSTYFKVEYPPENISISALKINVVEGERPKQVTCGASAYPGATYSWWYGLEQVSTGEALTLDYAMTREKGGPYTCVAQNKHGNISAETFINVLHKPECTLKQAESSGDITLVCDVTANPADVDFTWSRGNETLSASGTQNKGLRSVLALSPTPDSFGVYYCFANNSVGPASRVCEIEVTAINGWADLNDDNLMIIIALVVTAVLIFIIIIIILLLWCRKKRPPEKACPLELEERENPEGNSGMSSPPVQPVSKWPLKPGVHVHLKALHQQPGQTTGASTSGLPTNPTPPTVPDAAAPAVAASSPPVKPATTRPPIKSASAPKPPVSNAGLTPLVNEENSANTARNPPTASPSTRRSDVPPPVPARGLKSTSKTLFEKQRNFLKSMDPTKIDIMNTGGVSFQKLEETGGNTIPIRKRQPRPALDIGCEAPAADVVSSPSSELGSPTRASAAPPQQQQAAPPRDPGDKSFYENLPFHGLAPPPNKVQHQACSSRPPSELSHNGSSGYGSTRSQNDILLAAGYTGSLRSQRVANAILFSTSTLPYRRPLPRPASAGPPSLDGDLGIPRIAETLRPKTPVLTDRNRAPISASTQDLHENSEKKDGAMSGGSPKPPPRIPRPPHVYFNVPRPLNGNHMKPLGADLDDVEYAECDYRAYEPINYKKASMEEAAKRKAFINAIDQGLPSRPPRRRNTLTKTD